MELTYIEKQVMRGLFAGKRFTIIANDLGISVTKATETVSSIYDKYGVNDRIRLKEKVYANGILDIYEDLILKDNSKLIIIQGKNASGKTRLINRLVKNLQDRNISYFDSDYVSNNSLTKLLPEKNENLDYLIIDFPISMLEIIDNMTFNQILQLNCTKILTSLDDIENSKILEIASIYKL